MAIYHLSVQIISRGKGKSAVAAAAYRSGEKIINAYDGEIHDYTRKGGIVYTEILLPSQAPLEYADRSMLWNAVERIEKSKNSQLAREIELALPKELPTEQQQTLVREYCQKHFVSVGMCADICIHDKQDGNPHAHIMLTMRPLEQDGSWGAKSRKEYVLDENGERIKLKSGEWKSKKVNTIDWNEQTKAEEWRAGWADIVNEFLVKNNVTERIDHRSFERQGIEQIPTVHMGVSASQMERKGISTDRGNRNRKINVDNQELRQIKARINKLNNWLKDEATTPTDNLIMVCMRILDGKENKSQYKNNADIKMYSKMVRFLQENKINTLPELQNKVSQIRGTYNGITNEIKATESRLKVLSENIKYAENYQKYKKIYTMYKQQKPKKQDAFYDSHAAGIILYEAAERYLKKNIGVNVAPPIKKWKAEVERLTGEKSRLYWQFSQLKERVREVEAIKRSVEQTLRENDQPCKNTRERGAER